jgi:hypothetical protein
VLIFCFVKLIFQIIIRLFRDVFFNVTPEGESRFNQTQSIEVVHIDYFYLGPLALLCISLLHEIPRSYLNTQYSVRLLWTSDNTRHAEDRHPCHRRDSNPLSQQARGRRPTLYKLVYNTREGYKYATLLDCSGMRMTLRANINLLFYWWRAFCWDKD